MTHDYTDPNDWPPLPDVPPTEAEVDEATRTTFIVLAFSIGTSGGFIMGAIAAAMVLTGFGG